LLTLGPRYHSKMRSGEAVSRLTADITLIEQFLGTSASMATRTLITTFGALTMMLVVNWQLGLTLLAMLPVAMLPVVGVGRVIRTMSNRAQSRLADAGAEAAEALDAIELVQAYSREDSRLANFTEAVEATFAAAMRRITARSLMIVMVSVLLFGGFVCVLWLGARAVAKGEMSFGDLSAMVLYALYAGSGFGMLAEVYGEVMRAAGAADRAAEVLNAEPEIAPPALPRPMPEKVTGALAFDHVTFAYDEAINDGKPVSALTDFSLSVKPGEFVALVGPSGAGKTTVFRLALRLFDPQSGQVMLDGISSTEVTPRDWRRNFATRRRNQRCSPAQPPRISVSVRTIRTKNCSNTPPAWQRRWTSCRRRKALPHRSDRRAAAFPAASASGSRLPAHWYAMRRSSYWTKPPPRSTPRARPLSAGPSRMLPKDARRWSSRTACRPCAAPTGSSSWNTGGSSRRAATKNWWPKAGFMPASPNYSLRKAEISRVSIS
jgi:energy-coupling factor transporter ATP-binding protein EcfA2